MSQEPIKKPRGRPEVKPENQKKHRGLSLTDAEWTTLQQQAEAAGHGTKVSQYVVKKLRLNATPKPKQS